jgi:paraquat-inducible protein B
MGKRVSPALIGAFVVGAVALVVVAVTIWGSGRFFRHTQRFVCYFSGSVNGLNVGAPVKYRGVQVGEVVDIRIRYAQATVGTRIPVFIEVDGDRIRELGGVQYEGSETLRTLVERGLRARLQTLSIVTGVLYVEFDVRPDTPVVLVATGESAYPEVPTIPTQLEEVTKTIGDILTEVKQADVPGLVRAVREAAEGLGNVANSPDLHGLLASARGAAAKLDRIAGTLETRAAPLTSSLQTASDELTQTLTSVRGAADEARGLVAADAPLAFTLTRTLTELGQTARELSALADYLERNPNAIIQGRARVDEHAR